MRYIILFMLAIISCKDNNVKEFYPNGGLKYSKEYSTDSTYCETAYFENGEKEKLICFENGNIVGKSYIYHQNGSIYQESKYENGKLNGVTQSYYDNSALKSKSLYYNDSLFFIESHPRDTEGYYQKIIPIIEYECKYKANNCELSIEVTIPKNPDLPFNNDSLLVHYNFLLVGEAEPKYTMPDKSMLLKSDKVIIRENILINQEYILYGMITINDELLTKNNNHYFEKRIKFPAK